MDAVQLYKQGESLRSISEKLGRSHEWVRTELLKNNVELRSIGRTKTELSPDTIKLIKQKLKDEVSVFDISNELDISRHLVAEIAEGTRYKGWQFKLERDKLREKATALYAKYNNMNQVARELDLDVRTAKKIIQGK